MKVVGSHLIKQFALVAALLFAQLCYATPETDYRFNLITTEQGLPSVEITKIFQQSTGYIWIGTDRGASRFDGVNFKNYTYSPGSRTHISQNFITDILEDSSGNVWIATEDGLNVIRPNGQITIYKHDPNNPDSMPISWLTSLYQDSDGIIWIGSGYGLMNFDPTTDKFNTFEPTFTHKAQAAASVNSLIELESGELLVGTAIGLGIVNRDANTFGPYLVKNTDKMFYGKAVSRIAMYEENQLLVATRADGLFLYDVATGMQFNFRKKIEGQGISDNAIVDFTIDQDNNLWIAYENHGLSVHTLETGNFTHISKKDFEPFTIPTNKIRKLFIDRSGLVWVGTADGIAQYSPFTDGSQVYFKRPDGSQLSSDMIYSVFDDSETSLKWIASEEGLMSLDIESQKVIHYPLIDDNGKNYPYQTIFEIDQAGAEYFWLATANGLLLFDRATLKSSNLSKNFNIEDREIYTVLAQSDDQAWITGPLDIGLTLVDKKHGIIKRFINGDNSRYATGGNFTSAKILANDGAFMLAAPDGVFRVDQQGNSIFYPVSNEGSLIRTTSIIENTPGEFWIASMGLGVVRMTLNENLDAQFAYFNAQNGYPSNEIKSVLKDGEYLWFASKDNLYRMNFKGEKLQSFPNLFTVPQLSFSENSVSQDKNSLFLASSRGLISIDKSKIRINKYEAPIKITEILSANQLLLDNLSPSSNSITELEYQNNDIEIYFAALDYNNSSNTRYSYKLEGHNEEWSEATNRRSVSYNNLSFGEYTFKVKGTNSGGIWSDEIAEFKFVVLKPWWFYLIAGLALTTFLVLVLYVIDRRKQLIFLHEKAHVDSLTNVANRFSFNKKIEKALNSKMKTFALAIVDLDSFKEVNDTFGHQIGDTLLIEVTRRIKKHMRPSDFIARLGGDEFALIMTKYDNVEDFIMVTERIRKALEKDYRIEDQDIGGSSSIGVSVYPQDGTDAKSLLTHADAAMYEAKHNGKNNVFFFNESLNQTINKKLKIRANLKSALRENQFQVYYQPKYNQFTNQLIGAEALIRWIHPEDGFIPPDEFISEAESNGTIIEIGDWVLEEACLQTRKWQETYGASCRVSINVSAVQIAQPGFVKQVVDTLKKTQVDPKLIELEITESVLIESRQQCQQAFEFLQALGITIALDDFGVGFSSLSYLTLFSIDTLKIDRSFVNGIKRGSQNYMVLKNIYSLAQDLNMQVVAEGVEDQDQLDIIAGLNGAFIQGYFYSPAIKAEEFEKLFNKAEQLQQNTD